MLHFAVSSPLGWGALPKRIHISCFSYNLIPRSAKIPNQINQTNPINLSNLSPSFFIKHIRPQCPFQPLQVEG